MAINLHLQNLSRMAANLDIRRFFINWDIPEGGVQIIGGPNGDAFIRFNNENDLLKAMALSGKQLLGQEVVLRIISKTEMEKLINKRKKELHNSSLEAANYHNIAEHSGGNAHMGMPANNSAYNNPYTQVQQVQDNAYLKREYDSEDDDDRRGQGYDGDWKRRKPSAADGGGAVADRYDRNVGAVRGGADYGEYFPDEQRDYNQQGDGYTGRYGKVVGYGRRDDHGDGPGYIKISNLGRVIAYKDLREFFRKYDLVIMKGGITLKHNDALGSKDAFIQFTTNQDAIRANDLHNVSLQGRPLDIKPIHPNEFEAAKSSAGDGQQMRSYDRQQESYSREGNADSLPGYIKIHNLAGSVRYKELREFFRAHNMIIAQGGIVLINDQQRDSSTACIKFTNYQDALQADTLRYGRIQGQAIEMEMISSYQFEEQKAADAESQHLPRSTNFEGHDQGNRSRNDGRRDGSRQKEYTDQPGYIKISNVVASIRYNELREFFRAYDMVIAKGGIILKNYKSDFSTAYIQFVNRHDALKADSTRYGRLQGNNIEMELISASVFESQKAGKSDRYDQPKYDRYDQDTRSEVSRDTSRQRSDRGSGYSKDAGFIQIRNVDRSIRYKGLREFFRSHDMTVARGGIILPNDDSRDPSTVFVKFLSEQDATRAESLSTRDLPGNHVHIQRISGSKFENQESLQTTQGVSQQGRGPRTDEPRQSNRQAKSDEVEANYTPPGYIMMRNIAGNVRYRELRSFFRDHDIIIAKGGIILKPDETSGLCTVYMKFNSLQDALRADSLNYSKLCGEGLDVELDMISPTIFEYQYTESADFLKKSKSANADKSDQDKSQPRSFTDMSSAIAPGDKFECFIHLDQLPGDATACEVWGWFDGQRGFSKGVKLVRRANGGQAMFAYVGFDNAQHRNAAKVENEPCKAWSAKGTYRHLAQFGPQYEVLEATETGEDKLMDEDERAELRQKYYFDPLTGATETPTEPFIFTDMVERADAEEGNSKFLCFLFIKDLPKDATASSVWGQYGANLGGSKGVAVVRRVNGPAIFAYVSFADLTQRNAAHVDGNRKFSTMNMYMHSAQFGPHCEIEESIGAGGNQILPKEGRDLLRKKFFFEKVQVMQSIFSHMVARTEAEAPGVGALFFLRLSAIPEDATACGMRKWLGGTNKTSKGAIVVREIDPPAAMFAYVAFENRKDRQTALDECEDGLNLSVKNVCQHLAEFDSAYEIFESTDSGEDREIAEEKRESLRKKFMKPEEGKKDSPAKGKKRSADEKKTDDKGDEKKMKLEENASSDKEVTKEEANKKEPTGKQKTVRKQTVRQSKRVAAKEKPVDTEAEQTQESSSDTNAETEEVEMKQAKTEDVTVPSTRSTRRSTRRPFFEKQETENVDESEDNDEDDDDNDDEETDEDA